MRETRRQPELYQRRKSLARSEQNERAAKVQGVVVLEAQIELDGRVCHARVLRSIPRLDQSAIDAVMKWRFTPATLNGVAVPVIMTMTVNFTL